MQLSIIIVNYNTEKLLKQTITAILDHGSSVQYEIIVIDNNSSDSSIEMLCECFPDVRLIRNNTNAGFSKANNQGASIATGKYLLFLNSDTIVTKDSLEILVSWLVNNPEAAIVGPKLMNEDGSLQLSCGIFPNLKTEFYLRSFLSRLFPKSRIFSAYKLSPECHDNRMIVDWLSGACLMIRKDIFGNIHGFDERIFMFYEDSDLCYNVKKAGFSVCYLPEAMVYHVHGGSWRFLREIPVTNSCRSVLYFFKKHYPRWQSLILRIMLLFEIVLAYLIFLPYLILKKEEWCGICARLRGYNRCFRYIVSIHGD